ncbi:MAG: ferredoxin [Pseudomonadota bacterium]
MVRGIYVDEEECIGCALCAEIAPGVFQLNDEGVSEVIDHEGDTEDKIREAIAECPVECIHWEDE